MTMKCLKKSKKKHIQYIILCKDKSSHKDSNTMRNCPYKGIQ